MAEKSLLRIIASLYCFCALFPAIVAGQSASLDSVKDTSLDKKTLDLFAAYPQSHDLKVIIYSHARREPMEKSQVALYSTWFLYGNPRAAMTTIVNLDGRVFIYPRPLSEGNRKGSRWKEQPGVDLPLFVATVKTLPDSAPPMALADLVIVSFRLDEGWQTRLYDRKKAPAKLITLYQLAHSTLE